MKNEPDRYENGYYDILMWILSKKHNRTPHFYFLSFAVSKSYSALRENLPAGKEYPALIMRIGYAKTVTLLSPQKDRIIADLIFLYDRTDYYLWCGVRKEDGEAPLTAFPL